MFINPATPIINTNASSLLLSYPFPPFPDLGVTRLYHPKNAKASAVHPKKRTPHVRDCDQIAY